MRTPYIKKPFVELCYAANGKWYFHKVNKNGRITEPSQGYAHKKSAIRAAKRDVPGLQIVTVYA